MKVEGRILGEITPKESQFSRIRPQLFTFPPKVNYQIEAEEDSEFVLVRAKAEKGTSPTFSSFRGESEDYGKRCFEREVHTIVGEDFPAEKLIVGETFNKPGLWSSYPPHRHEKNRPPEEYFLEEVYHYRVEPEGGFGIQVLYTGDKELEEAI